MSTFYKQEINHIWSILGASQIGNVWPILYLSLGWEEQYCSFKWTFHKGTLFDWTEKLICETRGDLHSWYKEIRCFLDRCSTPTGCMPDSLGQGQHPRGPGLLAMPNIFKHDGVFPAKDFLCCFVILLNSFSDWLNHLSHFNQMAAAV